MTSGTASPIEGQADNRARWESEARREAWRWRVWRDTPCPACGELIGHFGGSTTREPCELIPKDVPLEEIRPNCYTVRRYWIGDAIRAVCDGKVA